MVLKTPQKYDWRVTGSYYESCNCEVICPCRKTNGMTDGRATYDTCDFILSWAIDAGHFKSTSLDGLSVAMIGKWHDGTPKYPWDIILYVEENIDLKQKEALSDIFLGKAEGNILFAKGMLKARAIKNARIELDHTKDNEWIKIGETIEAGVDRRVEFDGAITCGVPGHHIEGRESISSAKVSDDDFNWEYKERCGFAASFDYWRENF